MSHDKLDQQILAGLGEGLSPSADAAVDRTRDRLFAALEADAEPLHIVRSGEGEWERLQDGVTVKRLFEDPDTHAVTAIWKLEPGTTVEGHYHDQDEECLVLTGNLVVGGETLVRGDFLLGPKGTRHPTVVSPDGALLLIRSQDYRSAA
ncbi:MAG: cupin domain-containing protein [Pseudomonadota bacterium]